MKHALKLLFTAVAVVFIVLMCGGTLLHGLHLALSGYLDADYPRVGRGFVELILGTWAIMLGIFGLGKLWGAK
jgi:hypothetical protein